MNHFVSNKKNMDDHQDFFNWKKMKDVLKQKYPNLTQADLQWRDNSTREELLEMIASKLGVSVNELFNEI